jgi:hypothetical protein
MIFLILTNYLASYPIRETRYTTPLSKSKPSTKKKYHTPWQFLFNCLPVENGRR